MTARRACTDGRAAAEDRVARHSHDPAQRRMMPQDMADVPARPMRRGKGDQSAYAADHRCIHSMRYVAASAKPSPAARPR